MAIEQFLKTIFKEDYKKIAQQENIKKWKCFIFQLITNKEIEKKFQEEENILLDALLNIDKLSIPEVYDKSYMNLDHMVKKLIFFIEYSIKYKGNENSLSVQIALEWLYKMLERSQGK